MLVLLPLAGVVAGAGCTPLVRDAPFRGAAEQVTDSSLRGPFDGKIVDAATGEPIADAIVVGVWSYDAGSGVYGPSGSDEVEVTTDAAGRYRIGSAPFKNHGPDSRLVHFRLVVYKRGYASYRSDRVLEGGARGDFTLRHNTIRIRKWSESDSHAQHALFLRPPRAVRLASKWEGHLANLDLYRELGGSAELTGDRGKSPASTTQVPTSPELSAGEGSAAADPQSGKLLEASSMMVPADLQVRTGDEGTFVMGELGDLPRTAFYHGVHLEADGRGEEYDVAYRVWHKPPGGLDPVQARFKATFPDVPVTDEVTEQTWVYDAADIRAVAFIDTDAESGVLLTCGPAQCTDIETAIIVAKFLRASLNKIRLVDEAEPAEAATEFDPETGEETPVEKKESP
jgi:hypothetical protein